MSARRLAARVLVRVWEEGAFAAPALDAELARASDLDTRDAALCTELVYGVLRTEAALEQRVLAAARRGELNLTPPARAHLLIGAYSLLFLDRVPAFAAVSEAVAGVTEHDERAGGFANAVLRRVADVEPVAGGAPDERRPTLQEAIAASAPGWLRGSLRRALGGAAPRRTSARDRCRPRSACACGPARIATHGWRACAKRRRPRRSSPAPSHRAPSWCAVRATCAACLGQAARGSCRRRARSWWRWPPGRGLASGCSTPAPATATSRGSWRTTWGRPARSTPPTCRP
ncbi:MAG: transcription antitermination factor NusB [Polyangiaceae bacterium]